MVGCFGRALAPSGVTLILQQESDNVYMEVQNKLLYQWTVSFTLQDTGRRMQKLSWTFKTLICVLTEDIVMPNWQHNIESDKDEILGGEFGQDVTNLHFEMFSSKGVPSFVT